MNGSSGARLMVKEECDVEVDAAQALCWMLLLLCFNSDISYF